MHVSPESSLGSVPTMSSVAIIGAGPSGLAIAKALSLEPSAFAEITVYEKNEKPGGLWCYTPGKSQKLPDVSPMYKHLETNIVKQMMQYKDFPFPEDLETFPTRKEVEEYIQSYAKTISEVTFSYNSRVVSLEKREKWQLTVEGRKPVTFDAVILAHGHFETPFFPQVPGLDEWIKTSPQTISHAKYYNDAASFKGEKVLVVGNSASGVDLCTQLSSVADEVFLSIRQSSDLDNLNPVVQVIDAVASYNYRDNSIKTVSGKVYSGFDKIIFCTGYLYNVPFLKCYLEGEHAVIGNGSHICNLYKQMFYVYDPTLVFVGLAKMIIPMPFAESQGAYIARVLSKRLALPSEKEMAEEYSLEVALKGDGKEFHNMKFPAEVEYCKDLQREIDAKGLQEGFQAERWTPERFHLRSETGKIKAKRLSVVVDHALALR